MKSKRSNDRKLRMKRRRLNIENLECRQLLASGQDLPFVSWWSDSFVVRRDELEPVEITLNGWNHSGHATEPIENWIAIPENGTIEIVTPDQEATKLPTAQLTIRYQPAQGFTGIDRIRFLNEAQESTSGEMGTDASVASDIAIHVVEPLFAAPDWFQVEVNPDPTKLDVLANDIKNAGYIGDSPTLTLHSAEFSDGISNGSIDVSDDGNHLIFQADNHFEGVRQVSYSGADADGYPLNGTALIRVSDIVSEHAWPEQLETKSIQIGVEQNNYQFGNSEQPIHLWRAEDQPMILPSLPETDHSGTNNQITGVEESDRVKTDGSFLYVLSTPDQEQWFAWDIFPRLASPENTNSQMNSGNLLTIIDIRQADHPTIVSRQVFEDSVQSLDLSGNRLTVITERGLRTWITVIDVSEPTLPKTVSTTVINGNYVESRRVDDILYLFTEEFGFSTPSLQTSVTPDEEFFFYETAEHYFDRLSADDFVNSIFPNQTIYQGENEIATTDHQRLIDPHEIFKHYLATPSRSHVISIDVSANSAEAVDWQWGQRMEHRLVTPTSIYMTRTDYNPYEIPETLFSDFSSAPGISDINTEISHYRIDGTGILSAVGSSVVPGTLNNQFSMDEYGGNLRIATENSWWNRNQDPNAPVGTNLYVLNASHPEFEVIGGIEGLAPGEQVYAVRFDGERGYVVTFRQVDPLFVIDLTEPTAPEVMGQLKIPGYSQYLHVLSDHHLIGIGRDADETTGQYDSMVVSLFNVMDPEEPYLQGRYEFEGGRSTFSPFAGGSPRDLRDHHAISYFQTEQVLAIPIYSEAFGFMDQVEPPIFTDPNHSAIRTLKVDPDLGITEIDSIEFDNRVDRTVRIESLLYSISNQQLKVSHLHQTNSLFTTLDFETDGQDDYFDVESGEEIFADLTANDQIDGSSVELLKAELVEGEAEITITDDHQLHLRPINSKLNPFRIRYLAKNQEGTLIEAYATIDPDLQWQNQISKFDANQDGVTSARDALNIINYISRHGSVDCEAIESALETAPPIEARLLFDISGDRRLSAIDALQVINRLEENLWAEAENLDPVHAIPSQISESKSLSDGVKADQTLPFDDIPQKLDLVTADQNSNRRSPLKSTALEPFVLTETEVDRVFESNTLLDLESQIHTTL